MLPLLSKVDLFVTAPGTESARRTALQRLSPRFPLDGERTASLLRGERVLLRGELADEEAQRIARELRTFGLSPAIESSQPQLAMVELDGFANDVPTPAPAPPPANFLFDVSAGLVGLDGSDVPAATPPPTPKAPARDLGLGLGSLTLADADEPLAPEPGGRRVPAATAPPPLRPAPHAAPPPRAAPPPPPRAAPPPPVAPVARPAPSGDDRFRPSGAQSGSTNLELDVIPRDPMLSEAPPPDRDTFEVPRCPTHDVARVAGRCPTCDAEEAVLRGRWFGGSLRRKPPLRAGLGLGLGLALGWIITAPLARRAEGRVAYLREEAQRERSRPTEEAQANARAIDDRADAESNDAFLHTLGAWGLIIAVTAAGWYRLT